MINRGSIEGQSRPSGCPLACKRLYSLGSVPHDAGFQTCHIADFQDESSLVQPRHFQQALSGLGYNPGQASMILFNCSKLAL